MTVPALDSPPRKKRPSSAGALAVALAGTLGAPALSAQPPSGTFVVSALSYGTSARGGLFVLHPRSPGPPNVVSGLGSDLTGPSTSGSLHGANSVLLHSDGWLVVGELGNVGTQIDLHHLLVVGSQALLDHPFALGTSTQYQGGVAQAASLPGGDVVVGVALLGPPGPLAGEILGIVSLVSGTVTPVPVQPRPSGLLNALAVDPAGTTAYFTMHQNVPAPLYAVPLPQGGAPTLIAWIPGYVSNLVWANDGQLWATSFGNDLFRIHPLTGAVTAVPNTVGPANGLAGEEVTGGFAVVTTHLGSPPGSAFWMDGAGIGHLLHDGSLPTAAWELPSGVAVVPDPETYGAPTRGSRTFDWALRPNPGGLPLVGNAAFSLTIAASAGSPAGVAFLCPRPADVMVFGVRVLVDPGRFLLPLLVTGAGAVPLPIPGDPALIGGSVFLQSFHADPGGPSGIAVSRGVHVTFL